MKVWRKDNQKKDTAILNKKFAKNTKNAENTGEFTDINKSATISSHDSSDKSGKKQKMEEIYSTKDKQIRYKIQTPIEAEEAAKRKKLTKEELVCGNVEISLKKEDAELQKEVELKAELEEGTVVSDEIIENVDQFTNVRNVHIQDIDNIDIDLDPSESLRKYEKQVNFTSRRDARISQKPGDEFERIFGKPKVAKSNEKIVATVPVYQHESKVNKICLKAGKFTDVVEREYDEYLQSNDPTISKNHTSVHHNLGQKKTLLNALNQAKQQYKKEHACSDSTFKDVQSGLSFEQDIDDANLHKEKKRGGRVIRFFKIIGAVLRTSFVVSDSGDPKTYATEPSDYQDRQDARYVLSQTKLNIKNLSYKTFWLSLIAAALFAVTVMQRFLGERIFSSITKNGALLYCILNLSLLLIAGVVSKSYIISGLRPLRYFKGNSDTAASIAYFACVAQSIASLFTPSLFVGTNNHVYALIVVLAFDLNVIGRLIMATRVKSNFKFITSKSPAFAAKIYNDEELARKIMSGTAAQRPVIAYQHLTKFLGDFLKISYAPDPSEETAGKLTPVTLVCSVFVGIVYAVISKDIAGTLSALAVMCCVSIPMCALLAGNIPLKLFSKTALKNDAMVCGYPSVRQFCDCAGLMVSASELYPKGSVKLEGVKVYIKHRVEESMLAAAIVMKEAESPLASLFDKLIEQNINNLPRVESIMYEDRCGLVGWVNGDRVLIGNRSLMDRYHINIDSSAEESKYKNQNKQITFIALAAQVIAMVISTYSANPKLHSCIQKAEENGLCILVSTTDSNITADRIAEDYHIFFRTVKVLPTGYANVCNEVTSHTEDTSRAYLATRGKFTSLCRAVSGCIKLKNNLTIGIIIQLFGLILGVLLCATMALYAGVSRLGVIEILLYMLFWSAATIIAELIQKP